LRIGDKKKTRIKKTEETERYSYPVKYLRTIKDVKILRENGDAIVHFFHDCENTGNKEVPKIVHVMHYDGELRKYDVFVNGKKKQVKSMQFIKKILTNGESMGRLPRELKLTIDLHDEKIHPHEFFRYECRLEYDKVYKKMYEPGEEWSSYHVMMPTDSLKIMISAPKGSVFNLKNTEVRVEGFYEIEDFREEQRCKNEFPVVLMQDGTLLMWEILKPKIACTYYLYFQLEKRQ